MFGRGRDRRMIEPPTYTDGDGPRVLVECDDAALAWADERILTTAGYRVASCPGPDARSATRCPLLEEGTCVAAREADAILFGLSFRDLNERRILEAHRARRDAASIVIEGPPLRVAKSGDLVDGSTVIRATSRQALLEAIAGAAHPERADSR